MIDLHIFQAKQEKRREHQYLFCFSKNSWLLKLVLCLSITGSSLICANSSLQICFPYDKLKLGVKQKGDSELLESLWKAICAVWAQLLIIGSRSERRKTVHKCQLEMISSAFHRHVYVHNCSCIQFSEAPQVPTSCIQAGPKMYNPQQSGWLENKASCQ